MEKLEARNQTPLQRTIKIIIFSVALCIVMSLLLWLYLKTVPIKIAELEEKGKMDNTIWLVRYGSVVPPMIIIVTMLTLFYKFGAYLKVKTQRDKAVILAIVFAFTYLVLFSIIYMRSQGWQAPPTEGEEDVKSALELSVAWFCAQIVPFALAIGYHLIRASSEKKELAENEK